MPYDRRQSKRAARAAVREARPRPQLVILVFLLLTTGVSAVVNGAAAWRMTRSVEGFVNGVYYGDYYNRGVLFHAGALSTVSFFLTVLLTLYIMVMNFGVHQYALRLNRRQFASFRDLLSGFSTAGRVIAMNLLIFLFSFLWALLGCSIYPVLLLLRSPWNSSSAPVAVLLTMVLLVFLLNRVLRYALANFLLVDHPELGALEAIRRSKELMRGRLWSLVVLLLSFLGWAALVLLIQGVVWGLSALLGISTFHLAALVSGSGSGMTAQVLPSLASTLVFLVAGLASLPLALWLIAYLRAALAGFYDAACGYPQAPPDETFNGYDSTFGGYRNEL